MDFAITVLGLVCAANLFFGLLVLLRDPASRVTQSFFGISILISTWAVSNYITEYATDLEWNIFFNRAAFLFGFLAIANTALFSVIFTKRSLPSGMRLWLFELAIIAVCFLSVTDLVAGKVGRNGDELTFAMGPLVAIYLIAVFYCIYVIVSSFYRQIKHGSHQQRNQAQIMVAALTLSILIGVCTNIIIPAISSEFHSTKFGPALLSLFLISTVSYAIIRHQLFDIRRVIARTVTYLLVVGVMTAIYAAMVFGLANHLAPRSAFTEQIVPIATAIFLAFSVPYLKQIFDKLTNSIFFRDAYDPQVFLDQLNKTLVSNIELRILLRRTAQVIQENIKCEVCMISVRETEMTPFRVVGAEMITDKTNDLEYMAEEELPRLGKKVVTSDALSHNARLRRIFTNHNLVLITAPSGGTPGRPALTHLMLGPKKSGNSYSAQDIRLIEIITDELVIAIQNALRFEEIQAFNATLQARINEATNKLQRSNNKLQVLDQTKDEFISMASHQLRTPLTSIKGYLSMVLEGDAGEINDAQRKMLQQAFISAQRMTYLISDLLNVSRLKTGKFIIEQTATNLATVVQQEVEQLLESASVHNIELIYDQPSDFPTLELDETKIRQVIMNFLDNAIYYTKDGGQIKVELTDKPQSVELTITDSGIGVPKRIQHHLFTKFYRASNAKKARPDGTGLGLFMAKKIIVAQGGAIIFKSVEGKGSTFGFSFPKK